MRSLVINLFFLSACIIATVSLAWWTSRLTEPASTQFELEVRSIGGIDFDEAGETRQFLHSPRHMDMKAGSLSLNGSDFEVYSIVSPGGYSEGEALDPESLETAISLGHGDSDTFTPTAVPGRLSEDSSVLRSEEPGHDISIEAFGESSILLVTEREREQSSVLSAPGVATYSLLVMDSPFTQWPYQSLTLSRDEGDASFAQSELPAYFIYAKGDLEVKIDGSWADLPEIGGAPGRGVIIVGTGGDLEATSDEIRLQPAPTSPLLDEDTLPTGDILMADHVRNVRLSNSLGTLRVSGSDDEELRASESLDMRNIERIDAKLAGLPPSVRAPDALHGNMLLAALFPGIADPSSDPESSELSVVGESNSIQLGSRNLAPSEWDQDTVSRWLRGGAAGIAGSLAVVMVGRVIGSISHLAAEDVQPQTPRTRKKSTTRTANKASRKRSDSTEND